MFAFDDVEPADTGTNVNADVIRNLRGHLQTGVLHSLMGSRHRKVDEAAHLAGFLFVDEEMGIKVFDLSRKADGVAFEIVCLDLGHSTPAG